MNREKVERMESLCRLIQSERDPKKFDALMALNELLNERAHQLRKPGDGPRTK